MPTATFVALPLICSLLLLLSPDSSAAAAASTSAPTTAIECFSCASSPDWTYYAQRIPGLRPLNSSMRPVIAPIDCIFEPTRVALGRRQSVCNGYCFKWSSQRVRLDGIVEVAILRGCFDQIIDNQIASVQPPAGDLCFSDPAEAIVPGHTYESECFCKAFMCNGGSRHTSLVGLAVTLLLLRFLAP